MMILPAHRYLPHAVDLSSPLLSAMLVRPVMMWPVVSPPGRLSAFPHCPQKYALPYCSQEKCYSPGLSAAECLAPETAIRLSRIRGDEHMSRKLARTAASAVAAGAITAAGLCAAPAALAATDVPCSVTALAADVSSASSGETLSLAAECVYDLTAGLPVISQDLTIDG